MWKINYKNICIYKYFNKLIKLRENKLMFDIFTVPRIIKKEKEKIWKQIRKQILTNKIK